MDISVIIPVKNGEKYLRECLDSVFNQTFTGEYEVIVEIDPSEDKTVEIVNEYKELHQNLLVDLQNGLGVQGCRNEGIKRAKGKYVCFLDADDYYQKDYLKIMYEEIEKGYDVVNCAFKLKTDRKIRKTIFAKNRELDSLQACRYLLKDTFLRSFYWSKIFKKDLFKNGVPTIRTKGAIFEDVASVYYLLMHAQKVKSIKQYLYFYRVHDSSLTQTIKKERFAYHLKVFCYIRYLCDNNENVGYLRGFLKNILRCKLSLIYDASVTKKELGHSACKHMKLHKTILKDLKKKEKLDIAKYPEIEHFIKEEIN